MKIFDQQNISKGYLRNIYIDFKNSTFEFTEDEKTKSKLEDIIRKHNILTDKRTYLKWDSISNITNAIITINKQNGLDNEKNFNFVLSFLLKVNCKHIVIYFSEYLSVKKIKNKLDKFKQNNIHSVIIICEFHDTYFTDEFGSIIMDLNLNKKLIVLNSPFEKNFEDTMHFTKNDIKIKYEKKMSEFNANFKIFSESLKYQTYFNRKFYIGIDGEIKNAPECNEIFGYIQDVKKISDLEIIINKPNFKTFWFVKKENTDVCKDCEFKNICVDNRIPYKRTKNEWFHKIECNYNPYIAKWEGENGYQNLAEIGVISNMQGFSIDSAKIRELNKISWAE